MKKYLQAASTDLFTNPLVPKAHNSVSKFTILLDIKPVKASYSQFPEFYFLHPRH